jgi:hypothetical protein
MKRVELANEIRNYISKLRGELEKEINEKEKYPFYVEVDFRKDFKPDFEIRDKDIENLVCIINIENGNFELDLTHIGYICVEDLDLLLEAIKEIERIYEENEL